MAGKYPKIQAGDRFERLTVIEKLPGSYYRCLCVCGKETRSSAQTLRIGRAKSCGCYRKDRPLSHGHARKRGTSPEYTAWFRMRQRCSNSKHKDFKHYGARGIKVCQEWDRPGGFTAFLAEVGEKPWHRATLSRIDNDRGYEPGNVRWDSQGFQMNNTRVNRIIEVGRFRGTMKQAAVLFKIGYTTLQARLERGWTDKEALMIAVVKRRSRAPGGTFAVEDKRRNT